MNGVKVSALTIETLVKLLHKGGSRLVTKESIQADIERGAPTNSDGTINLISYGAWLLKSRTNNGTTQST